MCYNILKCIDLQKMPINNLDLHSNYPISTIKNQCKSCKSCKCHHVSQQRSAPHINKIASFSTETAILPYQKTAEIAEIVEKPP